MAFNSTTDALNLTFNEQTVVIAMSFVVSLLLCVLLAAFLFGALSHLSCGADALPSLQCPEWDESACGICCTYVSYRYCPRLCCSDWKRHMRESVTQMREELYEQEMEEMRSLETREREKREAEKAKWMEAEQSGKMK